MGKVNKYFKSDNPSYESIYRVTSSFITNYLLPCSGYCVKVDAYKDDNGNEYPETIYFKHFTDDEINKFYDILRMINNARVFDENSKLVIIENPEIYDAIYQFLSRDIGYLLTHANGFFYEWQNVNISSETFTKFEIEPASWDIEKMYQLKELMWKNTTMYKKYSEELETTEIGDLPFN